MNSSIVKSQSLVRYDAAELEVEISYFCGTDAEKSAAAAEYNAAWQALSDFERQEILAESDLLDHMAGA